MTSRRPPPPGAGERLRSLSRTAYTAAAGQLEVDRVSAEAAPRRRRWALLPRVAVVAVVVIGLLAVAVSLRAVAAASGPAPVAVRASTRPPDPVPSAAGDVADGGSEDLPAAGDSPALLVVHVVGQVVQQGVVELPPGSRVFEAIAAAGGVTPDADLAAVNLARVLVDGEQVVVPAPGEAVHAAASGGGASGGGALGMVNLNTATVGELDALPGIGPVLAQRIVDWRTENGRFTSVEELGEVDGIGPTLLGRLRDLVTP